MRVDVPLSNISLIAMQYMHTDEHGMPGFGAINVRWPRRSNGHVGTDFDDAEQARNEVYYIFHPLRHVLAQLPRQDGCNADKHAPIGRRLLRAAIVITVQPVVQDNNTNRSCWAGLG